MTTPIAVCIPSIGRSALTDALIEVVLEEIDVDPEAVQIWDNQETKAPHPDVPVIRAPGLTIYEEWNDFALEYGDTHHLAFLNDDIEMAPGTLQVLAGACEAGWDAVSICAHPNVAGIAINHHRGVRTAKGTFRQGGLNGWAFMIAKGAYPVEGIDPRFKVWYGDDDLFWKMRKSGKQLGVYEGVTVRHETSTTVNSLDWVPAAQAADTELWNSLGRP